MRTGITKNLNKLQEKIDAYLFDEVEETLALLDFKEIEMRKIDEEIIPNITDSTLEMELLDIEEYQEKIILMRTRANRLLKVNLNSSFVSNTSGSTNADQAAVAVTQNANKKVETKVK